MRGQTQFDSYNIFPNPRYTGYCEDCEYTFSADLKTTVMAVMEDHQQEDGHRANGIYRPWGFGRGPALKCVITDCKDGAAENEDHCPGHLAQVQAFGGR